MILIKYIVIQVLKNQLVILILLLLIFFCQRLTKILSLIIDGNVSVYFIFISFGLNIPEMGKLLIPFSGFFSVILTCHRLHMHNEIIAIYSCAISKYFLLKSIFYLNAIIAIFMLINISWLSPYCSRYHDDLLHKIRNNVDLTIFSEKKFQPIINKYLILFIDNMRGNLLKDIFLVKINQKNNNDFCSIVTADQGSIYQKSNGSYLIILKNGTYYTIHKKKDICNDVCVTEFVDQQILISNNINTFVSNSNVIDYMSMIQLWHSITPEGRTEFHWRLILLLSVFIMPMMAILLMINIPYHFLSNFLLAVVWYVSYFLLQASLRSYAILDKINPMIWMWLVNIIYCIMIFILYVWDMLCIQRLCFRIFNRNDMIK